MPARRRRRAVRRRPPPGAQSAGAVPDFELSEDEHDRVQLLERLRRPGEEEPASAARIALCEVIAAGLARVGQQTLWVSGALVGPHRASGESRHATTVSSVSRRSLRSAASLRADPSSYSGPVTSTPPPRLFGSYRRSSTWRMRSSASMRQRRRGCAAIVPSAMRSGFPTRFVLGRTKRSSGHGAAARPQRAPRYAVPVG